MTTCRELLVEAAESFQGLSPGDSLNVDELASGLKAVQWLMLRLHEARGPLTEVDVTADYTAGENERIRVQSGYTVSITMPNAISTSTTSENDYGFRRQDRVLGSTGIADGVSWRPPRDGARNEVVHLNSSTAPALYFFRSDLDSWVNVAALAIDDPMPLNGAYLQDAAALLAVRLCGRWPTRAMTPTPQMKADEASARVRLFTRPGVTRDPVRADYF